MTVVERGRVGVRVALALALGGCSPRTTGDEADASTDAGEGPAAAAGVPTEAGGSSTTGDEPLTCAPDPSAWCESVVCVPKNGACSAECDAACQADPALQGGADVVLRQLPLRGVDDLRAGDADRALLLRGARRRRRLRGAAVAAVAARSDRSGPRDPAATRGAAGLHDRSAGRP